MKHLTLLVFMAVLVMLPITGFCGDFDAGVFIGFPKDNISIENKDEKSLMEIDSVSLLDNESISIDVNPCRKATTKIVTLTSNELGYKKPKSSLTSAVLNLSHTYLSGFSDSKSAGTQSQNGYAPFQLRQNLDKLASLKLNFSSLDQDVDYCVEIELNARSVLDAAIINGKPGVLNISSAQINLDQDYRCDKSIAIKTGDFKASEGLTFDLINASDESCLGVFKSLTIYSSKSTL